MILSAMMFALGIFLISRTRSFRDLTHILFGNVLSVTTADLRLTAAIAVIVTNIEGLLITLLLPSYRVNIPSVFHVLN